MPTTIHLPGDLLKRVDRRASELSMSRNRYIRRVLEKAVENETAWSRRFLQMLAEAAADTDRKALDDMMRAIASRRTRKEPPGL